MLAQECSGSRRKYRCHLCAVLSKNQALVQVQKWREGTFSEEVRNAQKQLARGLAMPGGLKRL